jgi:predicted nucleotidyltransferase
MKKERNKKKEIKGKRSKKHFRESKNYLKNIIFTIAYYNALDYRPTTFYVWKNLITIDKSKQKVLFLDIIKGLKLLEGKKKIFFKNGFWSVAQIDKNDKQRSYTHKIQIQKNKISTAKIKQAKKWARTFSWLPYLRGLMLTGTLAMKRGGINSDWDVLVVLRQDRIWLGRFVLSIWLEFIRKRRYGKYIKDRFCLNQFMVNSELEFQERNEFAANEILVSRQLLGSNNLRNKFIQKNKGWIKEFKPNFKVRNIKTNKIVDTVQLRLQNIVEQVFEKIGLATFLNKIFKKIMIRKINNNPKTYLEEADIRYGDFFLIFLPHPQREIIRMKAYNLLTKND